MTDTQTGAKRALIFLHGHGSSEAQVPEEFRVQGDDGWVRICPRAPLPVEDGYSWFDSGPRGVDPDSLERSLHAIDQVIRSLTDDLGVAPSDIVLGGFSQGAATALAVAIARGATPAEPLGGLVVLAGFLPELFDDELEVRCAHARHVLVVHPSDDEVVPEFLSKDLIDGLERSTAVESVARESVVGGHGIGAEMVQVVSEWLLGLER